MARFKQKKSSGPQKINTSALPDIIFMLLFFFMVTTTMREVTLIVQVIPPEATEVQKLEKKSLVSYIYVGEPKKQFQTKFGKAPRIQLNDQWANVSDIQDYVIAEREARDEAEQKFMITSLKIDENTKMLIVADIKVELRKAAALHINYSSRQKRVD